MRRITGTILAGMLALGIVGCSPGIGSQGSTAAPAQEVSQPPQERYLAEVGNWVPESRDIPSRVLIEYGETVCRAFEAGLSVGDLGRIAGEQGIPPHSARVLGRIGGIAVRELCPEHSNTVREQLTH